MSTRIYDCPICKSAISINDKEDDLKPKICDKCKVEMKFAGTVGTSF